MCLCCRCDASTWLSVVGVCVACCHASRRRVLRFWGHMPSNGFDFHPSPNVPSFLCCFFESHLRLLILVSNDTGTVYLLQSNRFGCKHIDPAPSFLALGSFGFPAGPLFGILGVRPLGLRHNGLQGAAPVSGISGLLPWRPLADQRPAPAKRRRAVRPAGGDQSGDSD